MLDWRRANRPELTQVVEHAAKEAWEEVALADDALKVLADEWLLVGDHYHTAGGERIDGLKYIAAGRPKSFKIC